MSWSIYTEGTPTEVKDELAKSLASYTQPSLSRAEFEEIAPILKGLIERHGNEPIRLEASGHATPVDYNATVQDQVENRTQTTISICVWRKQS